MRALKILLVLFALSLPLALSGEPVRASPQATLSVTMSNPYCIQASPASSSCYINLRWLTASATDQTFTHLDISIDGRVRFRMLPFFETTVYLYSSMLGNGFLVSCGLPNAGGDPAYGSRYQVAYSGYLLSSSAPAASGSANVYCPAFEAKVYMPLTSR